MPSEAATISYSPESSRVSVMTEPTPPLDDPNALAAIVGDSSQSMSIRNAAYEKLMPTVEKIAKRVLQHFGWSNDQEDLLNEGLMHVRLQVQEGKFDRTRSNFTIWCKTVLTNFICDQIRKQKRHQHRFISLHSLSDKDKDSDEQQRLRFDPPDRIRNDLENLIRNEMLSESDLMKIRRWKPLSHRVIILVLADLWPKIPETEWQQWVNELDWPSPFPPQQMQYLNEPTERAAALAETLGMKRNTIDQIWHRKKRWLIDLDYIRMLREDDS